VIPDLSLEELARCYNNSAAVPGWRDQLQPRWVQVAAEVRGSAGGPRDVVYGPGERQRFDVFLPEGRPPTDGWPTMVFIHGGYWQSLSKDDWSAIAAPFVANGMGAVILGYTLCPENTVRGIAEEIESAIAYVWHEAARLGIDESRLALVGHSAGGHLTAWCMTVDWTRYHLPATPFVSATAISGIFDLEPLVPIYLNDALRLTNEEALAMSPAYRSPRVDCPFTAAVGGDELEEFHRQNHLVATEWTDVQELSLPGLNHFTIIDQLTRDGTTLFGLVCTSLLGTT
jgi:arylformamidase